MTQLAPEICSRCSRPIRPSDIPYLHKEKVICELCHAALHPAAPAPHPPLTARLNPTPRPHSRPAVPAYRLLQLTGNAFHLLALLTSLLALLLLALAIKSTLDARSPNPQNLADVFSPVTAAVAYSWAGGLFLNSLFSLAIGQSLLRLRDLTQNSHRALLP